MRQRTPQTAHERANAMSVKQEINIAWATFVRRILKGVPKRRMADMCGISVASVNLWADGRNAPHPAARNHIKIVFEAELQHVRNDLEQRAVHAATPAETFALMDKLREIDGTEP